VSVVCVGKYITSWLVIDSSRHRSWLVSNWTELRHRSKVIMEHDDGYGYEYDVGNAKQKWLLLLA
jgi:hypothetical protein